MHIGFDLRQIFWPILLKGLTERGSSYYIMSSLVSVHIFKCYF